MRNKQKAAQTKTDIENIAKFSEKNGFDITKTRKCLKYYLRKTKRNGALALSYTYDYIDDCYKDKKYDSDLPDEDKTKVTNELLNRFNELNKKHKFSYSIVSSVVASFFVTLFFVILQTPDNKNGLTFWETISNAISGISEFLANNPVIVSVILFPIFIIALFLVMLVPIGVLIVTYLISDLLYYSTYRNMVVPYERKIILNTLITFDERYKELN